MRRLPIAPDAVLVSGDLADTAPEEAYAVIQATLATLDVPAYVLPGNHDHRASMRRHFSLPGEPAAPVYYAVDVGPLRLVALDTSKPGDDAGELGPDQLDWLGHELAGAPDRTTLIAMHHPPFATGIPFFDAIGLAEADRISLADIVQRHPQVRRIVAGHVHRAMTAEFAARVAVSAPSTYVQARLDFDATRIEFADEPPGFVVHALDSGELVSHFQPVTAA